MTLSSGENDLHTTVEMKTRDVRGISVESMAQARAVLSLARDCRLNCSLTLSSDRITCNLEGGPWRAAPSEDVPAGVVLRAERSLVESA